MTCFFGWTVYNLACEVQCVPVKCMKKCLCHPPSHPQLQSQLGHQRTRWKADPRSLIQLSNSNTDICCCGSYLQLQMRPSRWRMIGIGRTNSGVCECVILGGKSGLDPQCFSVKPLSLCFICAFSYTPVTLNWMTAVAFQMFCFAFVWHSNDGCCCFTLHVSYRVDWRNEVVVKLQN